MRLIDCKSIVHKYCVFVVIICLANSCFCQNIISNTNNNNNLNSVKNEKDVDNPIIDFDLIGTKRKPAEQKDCCEETITIYSHIYPEGYLRAPPFYDSMNEQRNSKRLIECLYKFYGKPGERIQLFYEDVDLYYPFDIYKLNKIDCRYTDSICLKFYESSALTDAENKNKFESITIENHNYDLCNCINVSYTPRQIMSASNFIQVRFRTVPRSYETAVASIHSRKQFRGYLIRYRFTSDNGLDNIRDAVQNSQNTSECKIYFYSTQKRSGYFSSPNYPGLYPRDIECHYYFIGQRNEKVQITFHTFDVEGIDQCTAETKSDYVELSNFQNRDRFYSRFCGTNKPSSVLSDASFFHVTFYSNNVFDAKGFQASYYFLNLDTKKIAASKSAAAAGVMSDTSNSSSKIRLTKIKIILVNLFIMFVTYSI